MDFPEIVGEFDGICMNFHAESIDLYPKRYEKESKGSRVTVESDGFQHRRMEDLRLLRLRLLVSHVSPILGMIGSEFHHKV